MRIITKIEQTIFDGLSELGAGDFTHCDGTLERHLVAVHDLLQAWGADETLCLAGLYHAAYGTAGFDEAMVSTLQRHRIARLIGRDAEQIVYTYCACPRRVVWPQIGEQDKAEFIDRFNGSAISLERPELRAFCELTCANEVEIAVSDPSFVQGAGRHLGRLFGRWHRHLSEPARQATSRAFLIQ